jgi:hypothetical protein
MNLLKQWRSVSTKEEQQLLAHRVGTTHTYLFYHLAADEATKYKREPDPELAKAIERETEAMHKASKGRLPRIYRTDLVKACAQCEFAQRCLGAAAVRADFEIVTPQMLDAGVSDDN